MTIAVILSGGIGLGACQAGAYAQLLRKPAMLPRWLAGSCVGAVNCVIGGNSAETRMDARLC